jgi:TonB-dependent SusC/RagA subfamily outer membrane receptor
MWTACRTARFRPAWGLVAALVACGGGPASATGDGGSEPAPAAPDSVRALRTPGTLTAEELEGQHYARIEELIEGRVSGVRVIRLPNGEFSLRIRGTSSPSGSNEPLVVIDGMPVPGPQVGAALAGLNPLDVARIEVLKDAQATAFYGMRGANGVLVITTKRDP